MNTMMQSILGRRTQRRDENGTPLEITPPADIESSSVIARDAEGGGLAAGAREPLVAPLQSLKKVPSLLLVPKHWIGISQEE